MALRHQAEQENEAEEEQQGRRGLSFKCLRSFRHKISEDDWRRQQDPGLEPGSKVSSRGGSGETGGCPCSDEESHGLDQGAEVFTDPEQVAALQGLVREVMEKWPLPWCFRPKFPIVR